MKILKQTLRSDLVNSWMKSEEKTKLRGLCLEPSIKRDSFL